MDTRLLDAYNRELGYLQEMGAEFAAAYPAIAAGLGLSSTGPKDPYVERLLEGCAFLAARTQLKLDARHPEFTQHLLEVVYPGFLSPIPSCAVAEFVPDFKEAALAAGVRIPRASALKTQGGKSERTRCEFRTAHDVVLWPLEILAAEYHSGSGALAAQGLKPPVNARAALRIRLRVPEGIEIAALPVRSLTFFIAAPADLAARLHEQVIANCAGVAVRGTLPGAAVSYLEPRAVTPYGLDDAEALLPVPRSGFQGYRLLQEYFAFPQRLLFFDVQPLRASFARVGGRELEIFVLFDRAQAALENRLDEHSVRLYCTPIVNLFPRSSDRVHVSIHDSEMHVTVDRNRPMDFEIHSITGMKAIGGAGEVIATVPPLHRLQHASAAPEEQVFYTLQRRARLKSLRQQQTNVRTQYLGSELFVSITDRRERQFSGELRQLDLDTLCTNRDLPLQLVFDPAASHFSLDGAAPLDRIRCLAGPTRPRPSAAFGDTSWRLLSHLTLNYLSLVDQDAEKGAEMLRGLLELYANPDDAAAIQQVAGVQRVRYQPVVRRVPSSGPIVYGRGLEITATLEDSSFEGVGLTPLALVLEQFFARYASINSFTQLRLESLSRGEIKRWPVRIGKRQIL